MDYNRCAINTNTGETMNEKLVTLKTNHTILAQVDCNDKNQVLLKEPVVVIVQTTPQGPMAGFSPYLDYAEEFNTGIAISMDNILCITTPSRALVNEYNKLFGSGIQIASSVPKI